jgi:serine/threonine protein kinase
MGSQVCPSSDELQAFCLGLLEESPFEAVAAHLDRCESCQSTIDRLPRAPDTLGAELRRPPVPDPFVAESECGDAVRRFKLAIPQAVPDRASGDGETAPRTPIHTEGPTPAAVLRQVGHYQLIEKLGAGGMGTVYKAIHTKLKRVVALKVIAAERLSDSATVTRFNREMEAVGRLRHPNIVEAFDAGEADGTHFLVMEFVDGLDVATIVDRCGPLPVADACEVVRQAAIGLQHAHEHGLVHRDIKPSNLILEGCGRETGGNGPASTDQRPVPTPTSSAAHSFMPRVKILDLGLARLHDERAAEEEITSTGQVLGTVDYMAPEQAFDPHSADIRADIYSLGCTLFKLLVGHPPYVSATRKSALQRLLAHAQSPVPNVLMLRPDIPDQLGQLVSKLMSKNPADRLHTPGELARALDPFATGARLDKLATAACTSKSRRTNSLSSSHQEVSTPANAPALEGKHGASVSGLGSSAILRSKRRRLSTIAAMALALSIVAIASFFGSDAIRLVTNRGLLEIKTTDPNVRVRVLRGGAEVEIADQANDWKVSLKAGEYTLELASASPDVEITEGTIAITRNGHRAVEIRQRALTSAGPRPLAASNRHLTYDESFDDPSIAQTWRHADSRGTRTCEDGKLVFELVTGTRTGSVHHFGPSAFHVAIETRFRASESVLGFIFREVSFDLSKSHIILKLHPDGSWQIQRRFLGRNAANVDQYESRYETLAKSQESETSVPLSSDQWNDLSIEASGDEIQVQLNGRELARIRDLYGQGPEFRSAGDGVAINQEPLERPSTHVSRLELDYLRVWQIDEPSSAVNVTAAESSTAPARSLILEETFDNPKNDPWRDSNGRRFSEDGKLIFEIFEGVTTGLRHAFGDAAYQVAFETRFRMNNSKLAIRFREATGERLQNKIMLWIRPDGTWVLKRHYFDRQVSLWHETRSEVLAPSTDQPHAMIIEPDKWHDLKVEAWGNRIQIQVDGKELVRVIDPFEPGSDYVSTGGAVVFLHYSAVSPGNGTGRVELDHLRAWRLGELASTESMAEDQSGEPPSDEGTELYRTGQRDGKHFIEIRKGSPAGTGYFAKFDNKLSDFVAELRVRFTPGNFFISFRQCGRNDQRMQLCFFMVENTSWKLSREFGEALDGNFWIPSKRELLNMETSCSVLKRNEWIDLKIIAIGTRVELQADGQMVFRTSVAREQEPGFEPINPGIKIGVGVPTENDQALLEIDRVRIWSIGANTVPPSS